ncbi:MAG TPA: MlaD family protein [Caulobacteraceae bacterium]|jgi:phospholipid/cholesterol/gamma-HCH transport system substrate-binding protein|nr:MlaD family protein [Caulobacteraceae bacterium]
MERNANYALVGLIASVLLVCIVVFVVWLAGARVNPDHDRYDIVFRGPVRGLADGGEVHFNGIKVGSVTHIGLDPHDAQLVVARVSVTSDVPIRRDSYAVLEPQGITGVNYVQISAGSPNAPLLKDTVPDGVVPRLSSRRDTVSDLLAGSGDIVQRTVEALDRINRLLSNENLKNLAGTLDNVQSVTAELRAQRRILADADAAVQSAGAAMHQVDTLARSSDALINGPARTSLTKLDAALDEVRAATGDLHATVHGLAGPTQTFMQSGLPELSASMQNLQSATQRLDQLLSEAQSNPSGFIAKGPAKEVKIAP